MVARSPFWTYSVVDEIYHGGVADTAEQRGFCAAADASSARVDIVVEAAAAHPMSARAVVSQTRDAALADWAFCPCPELQNGHYFVGNRETQLHQCLHVLCVLDNTSMPVKKPKRVRAATCGKKTSSLRRPRTERSARYGDGAVPGNSDVNVNGCFANGINATKCLSGATVPYVIEQGTLLYHARPGSIAEAIRQPFYTGKTGTEETYQFFDTDLSSNTLPGYARSKGYDDGCILVYKALQPIRIYLQRDLSKSDCEIYFDTVEAYASKEAQCFCKAPYSGYGTLFRGKLTDIGLCSPARLLKFVGWIRAYNWSAGKNTLHVV